mgnify:CR=1 FL=1
MTVKKIKQSAAFINHKVSLKIANLVVEIVNISDPPEPGFMFLIGVW